MFEDKSIEVRIDELTDSVKKTIASEMKRLYDKMTPSEIHALDTNNPRFTKLLLCGLDMSKLIENQYATESMMPDLRKVRRIRNSNR